jgi:hypothetical protein
MSEQVKDLSTDIRDLLELQPGSGRIVRQAPSPERREEIGKQLQAYFAEIDKRTDEVDPAEWDRAVDEAMGSVRPGYQRE